MKNKVSIIIINFNTFEITCKCIKSIYEKTQDINFEIILVDNASVECEPELFKKIFPDIILIKSKKNLGFSRGNNLGIKYAHGEVVLLLNSDTELINNAVKIAYDKLIKSENVDIISSALYYYDRNIQKQCNKQESILLMLLEVTRLHLFLTEKKRAKLLQGSYFDHESEIYTDKVWGTFFMFKKEILNKFPNKKLQETFFMYGEDVEWCYYLRNNLKKQILYYPKAKIYHLGGASSFNLDKTSVQIKNRYVVLKKYHSKLYLKVFGFVKFFGTFIEEIKNDKKHDFSNLIWNTFVKLTE